MSRPRLVARTAGMLAAAFLRLPLSGCIVEMQYGSDESRVEAALVKLIGEVSRVEDVSAIAQFSPTAKGVSVTVTADAASNAEVRDVLREVLPAAVLATCEVKYGSMNVTVTSDADFTFYADASDLGLTSSDLSAYREAYGQRTGS